MKTANLIGLALNWAVSVAEMDTDDGSPVPAYSTNWAQGGPIIEREEISTTPCNGAWDATSKGYLGYGPTPLIAAMRCYVASKLGDEIEIPEEME